MTLLGRENLVRRLMSVIDCPTRIRPELDIGITLDSIVSGLLV